MTSRRNIVGARHHSLTPSGPRLASRTLPSLTFLGLTLPGLTLPSLTFLGLTLLTLTLLTLILLSVQSATAAWAGREVSKGGVVHVENPAQPSEGRETASLEELWRLGGDTDSDEEFFGVISQIATDASGNVYLLDQQLNEVKVFAADGSYVTTVGREGEGPGEFRNPADLTLLSNGNVAILQRMPGKIVLLTPAGEPAGELPTPPGADGGFMRFDQVRSVGDGVVLSATEMVRTDTGADITQRILCASLGGDVQATYIESHDTRNFANRVFDEKSSSFRRIWDVTDDGRVYFAPEFDDYEIRVWRPDGTLDRVIQREYEPRTRSDEEMKRVSSRMSTFGPRGRGRGGRGPRGGSPPEVKVSATDRSIQGIYPRGDGSVWVLSSRGALDAPGDALGTFDVFDSEGHFTQQWTLQGVGNFERDGFFFTGDRLYVVTDLWEAVLAMRGGGDEEYDDTEEAEPVSVICYRLPEAAVVTP